MTKTSIDAYDIIKLLEGTWSLTRKITNNLDKAFSGSAIGIAEFIPDNNPDILFYNENLKVYFNNDVYTNGKATYSFKIKNNKLQQYLLTPISQSLHEKYMFELNFTVQHNKKQASATYNCANDQYNVTYSFISDSKLNIIYTVSGPNKNYIIETNFKKRKPNKEI